MSLMCDFQLLICYYYRISLSWQKFVYSLLYICRYAVYLMNMPTTFQDLENCFCIFSLVMSLMTIYTYLQSGKACLGEEFYRILSAESVSAEEMLNSLSLKSEHNALEAVNRLEAAVLAWKERIIEQTCGKSPVRTSWSFIKDPISDLDKMEFLLDQAEALIRQLKTRYPNLVQTFLDVVKVKYGKVSLIKCNFLSF